MYHRNINQKKLGILMLITVKEKKIREEKLSEIKRDNTNGKKVYSL